MKSDTLIAVEEHLQQISAVSLDFLVLLALSTIIATLGLFLNSPAVIIGAMIIAPLMRPLSGLSLACLTADIFLLRTAILTLGAGTLCGASIAYLMALSLQAIKLTPEIIARTRPNLLDLGVAMAAGAVGAYCQIRKHSADTLAGVAIAVALVPPLSVIGIGLDVQSLSTWIGAALLYATNLIGISVAGALVFFIMGYTPLHQAKRGLLISGALISILTIPLGLSMRELILENQLNREIKRILKEKTHTFKAIKLQGVEVKRFQKPTRVTATIFASEQNITPQQLKLVQDFLVRETGIPIDFRLRIVPLTEVSTVVEVSPTGATTMPMSLQMLPGTQDSSVEASQGDGRVLPESDATPPEAPLPQMPRQPQSDAQVPETAPEHPDNKCHHKLVATAGSVLFVADDELERLTR